MTLQVVGAGLGRTGTHSLKIALEQLLGGPCYHMVEVFQRPGDVAVWQAAVDGDPPDWAAFLADYAAAVDWPAAAFWAELSAAFPDAVVLLSLRDTDGWWQSAQQTIFAVSSRPLPADPALRAHLQMIYSMFDLRFTAGWADEATAKAAYERHNETVRARVAPGRLVEWHSGDGWEPLCAALHVAVPDQPFPHVNTTSDFRAMAGLDEPD
jgi:hypothetical protein